jgi:hypothetical protein
MPVNTDNRVCPLLAVAPSCGRRLRLRYASRNIRAVLVAATLGFCTQLSMAADWLEPVPSALWPRLDWLPLPMESFAEVPVSKFFVARINLADAAFTQQNANSASSMLGREFACAPGSKPFLVRALFTVGGTGKFQIYWAKDSLVVEHGSLGGGNMKSESALVACLSRAPLAVFGQVAGAL